MDQDPVLRALSEDIARNDPRLAAMLGRHRRRWPGVRGALVLLLALAFGAAALLLPVTVVIGAIALLLAAAAPLVACWLCAESWPPPAQD